MTLAIHLLGVPRVLRDGVPAPAPPGRKAWALLAFLLLGDGPVPRERLATLFEEAGDPLAALRWNLNALRRLLGSPDVLRGRSISLELPPGTFVDVDVVRAGSWRAALDVPGLGHELLEAMCFPTSPTFELWLTSERRRLAGASEAVLHEAALARLGAGEADEAADLAARLVGLNAFDENFQALLVRCLSSAGRGVDAARQAARCRELFRRELGKEPGPELAEALRSPSGSPSAQPSGGAAAVRAQLQAGRAALAAGAADAGLHCLRRAVADAAAARLPELHAEALVALGTGLVHSVRGADEGGAAALHEGLHAAERHGCTAITAEACRELGYVDFLQARYDRGRRWLGRASSLAGGEPAELARIRCIAGAIATDCGDHTEALAELDAAADLARRADDRRQLAYVQSMIGRARLLQGDAEWAAEALDVSMTLAQECAWTAMAPWPEALRAECHVMQGEVELAETRLEQAYALGCELGDPCWQAIAARGLGRVAAARGDIDAALGWFDEADERAGRSSDGYVWVRAYTLDAACAVAVEHRPALAPALIDRLERLADRAGMRGMSERGACHRAALYAATPR